MNNENIQSEHYYLINQKFLADIKNYIEFNIFCKNIENNNNLILDSIDNLKIEHLLSLITILPNDFLNNYLNKEIVYDKGIIEPEQISLKYSNNEKQNEIINIYDNFDIISHNLIELFIGKSKKYNNLLAECFF